MEEHKYGEIFEEILLSNNIYTYKLTMLQNLNYFMQFKVKIYAVYTEHLSMIYYWTDFLWKLLIKVFKNLYICMIFNSLFYSNKMVISCILSAFSTFPYF